MEECQRKTKLERAAPLKSAHWKHCRAVSGRLLRQCDVVGGMAIASFSEEGNPLSALDAYTR
jgi:hypothetical protein